MTNDQKNPTWWNDKHSSSWDSVKNAFARDWEQTKADFSKDKGHELNQNAADTVKQAAGKEAALPVPVPNAKGNDDYASAEPALRYGWGAASQHGDHKEWDSSLEGKLRGDWDSLKSGRTWDDAKQHVRAGWQRAKKVL